jgi:acetylornithine deacetylase
MVGDPTSHRVVTGHKGGLGFRVQIRGFEVHSSIAHRGVSAIMEGARLIQWANDCNAASAAATPGPLAAPFDPPWTNLHVGMIRGGTAHNITARDCEFVLTFRTVPGDTDWESRLRAQVARIEAGMQAIHPDAGITLSRVFDMPPLRPEPGGRAEALARRLTGDNGTHVVSYGTEGGQFQAQGYSAIVCGPGDIAQAHQPDEWLAVSEFEAAGAMLARVIDDLCQ